MLDVGAGTGALSLLAAELGYRVTALDLSDGHAVEGSREGGANGAGDRRSWSGRPTEPPPGPFDAIMERHVVWTMPDPVAVLRAWREVVVPGGRLVLFEGVWGRRHPSQRVKEAPPSCSARRSGTPPDHHHAPYPPEVLAQLPLARDDVAGPADRGGPRAGGGDFASNACATSSGPRCSTTRGRSAGWRRGRATR